MNKAWDDGIACMRGCSSAGHGLAQVGSWAQDTIHLLPLSPPQASPNVHQDAVLVKPAAVDELGQDLGHALLSDRSVDAFDTLATAQLVLSSANGAAIESIYRREWGHSDSLTPVPVFIPHLLALHDAVEVIKSVSDLYWAGERERHLMVGWIEQRHWWLTEGCHIIVDRVRVCSRWSAVVTARWSRHTSHI